MEYRVLGPLDVVESSGRHLSVGGAQQQSVLATLLLRVGQTVTFERLVNELWEEPPETAVKTVQVYVSRLRHELPEGAIESRPGGYTLILDGEELDLLAFEKRAEEGRNALAAGDSEQAAALLRQALELWRGPALAGLTSNALRREADRLEELRLRALEDRFEADLGCDREREVIPELQALVAEHPFRERPRGQLMLALYRAGRQTEALEAYQNARRALVDELGIEPSAPLRGLEQAILRQDAELGLPPPPTAPPQPQLEQPLPAASQPEAPREVRKTVTVLFSDLVGSTRLGKELDPEALRRLMSRYFDDMRGVLERHGGGVEKYIGDAVMAAFGIPVLHEDDALRAVRAAVEMRERLDTLNTELERVWGVRLAARIGINTGEVIAGDSSQGHLFVTGEAVNIAKRLEEVAEGSEILIGNTTHRLVRDSVRVEPGGPRTTKGGEAIGAFRVVEVLASSTGRTRRFDSPLVGRERQLESLVTAFRNAVTDRVCHLFTVLGAAGVGKSRLVEEFARGCGDEVTVLRGRCLPYGEGITYWPVAEVLRDAAGGRGGEETAEQWVATIAAQLGGEPKAESIAERVAEALGLAEPGGKREETFWAVRRLFEALARRGPLALVFDDLQWAEPTFLDLVEHLADFSRDVPLLLLCVARPELVDDRPGWGGGKLNASSILLEPLSDCECRQLIANLLDRPDFPGNAEGRIAAAAEGNPLFAEELLAMMIDSDLLRREDGHWTASDDLAELPVPPTIHALLAARLERLPDDERVLVERVSVEGAVFHRSSAGELTAGSLQSTLDETLLALVRKDVIRPDRADFAGEEAFRFRHLLIRDAAYGSLPKEIRADLHERFADWLESAAGARLREFEEIVGYHLEQAYSYRIDLGSIDAQAASLAGRASQRLESAGRRALARSDVPAAIGLLERAAALLAHDDPARLAVLPELAAALIEGGRLTPSRDRGPRGRTSGTTDAESILAEAEELASSSRDERAESRVLVQQQFLQLLLAAEGGTGEAAQLVERVIPVFERYVDHHGLCRARRLQGSLHWTEGRAAAAAECWEQAAAHARRAGDEDERSEILCWVGFASFFGPVPVAEGIRRCERIRAEVAGNLAAEAETLQPLAGLHAMEGSFELARTLLATSDALSDELGQTLTSSVSHARPIVEMLAGDAVAAEKSLRAGYRALEEMGERAFLSTTAAYLAQAILAQGRDEEAERFTELSEELAAGSDLATQVMWRVVRAKILAKRRHAPEAEKLAREAVVIAERTDLLNDRADAQDALGRVLRETGRVDEARVAAFEALRLYEQKGNIVAAASARAYLAELDQV